MRGEPRGHPLILARLRNDRRLDDADDVAAFLDHYRDACVELAIDPLTPGELADMVAAMLRES